MINEQILLKYIDELASIRTQLEYRILTLQAELDAIKHERADQSQGTLGPRELHTSDSSVPTPGPVS